ncbi:MAG: winged helix-turn-helix transcriptional regulator [Hydrogenophaga sp.]|uniref:MarR family winged helix-turn-helix transcriptional regulator n=1 Tax=Hydrogenophaga sp. TaxID=1904254 RepID=UPI001D766FBC|nr:MarR family winged helix-turn-helix transcriptional regulator [Hydrogenophaga sp.]MBX3611302.1 winged helix-turn-helix transcriptional regulator [Hydrogenophaga sp.]
MTRPADTDILDLLSALMHGMRRHTHTAVQTEGEGLGPMEARCLNYFAHHDGHTQRDLVRHSGRDKAQIARLVRALMERGLLVTTPDPDDARSQQVHVTAEGRALQRRLQQHRLKLERTLTQRLQGNEKAQLLALLGRLRDAMPGAE